MISNPANPATSLVSHAALVSGLHQSQIWSDRKTRRLVHVRWAVWLVLRRAGFSLTEIAEMFGRDHGTILHGVHRITTLIPADPWLHALVNRLSAKTSHA